MQIFEFRIDGDNHERQHFGVGDVHFAGKSTRNNKKILAQIWGKRIIHLHIVIIRKMLDDGEGFPGELSTYKCIFAEVSDLRRTHTAYVCCGYGCLILWETKIY